MIHADRNARGESKPKTNSGPNAYDTHLQTHDNYYYNKGVYKSSLQRTEPVLEQENTYIEEIMTVGLFWGNDYGQNLWKSGDVSGTSHITENMIRAEQYKVDNDQKYWQRGVYK